ncbi:hypothetical protein [Dyella silvatica]|uniref:hypothetical protein n=1 Tax=Dyella silvatica TaxID=2992128 RepID=UPI002257828F|nr:hypothetical protein [Dyella silvatica]
MSSFIHRVNNSSKQYVQLIVLNPRDQLSYDLLLGPGQSTSYNALYGDASLPVPVAESASSFTDSHIRLVVGGQPFALYQREGLIHCVAADRFDDDAPLLEGFAGPGPVMLQIDGDGDLVGEVAPLYTGAQLASVSWADSRYALYSARADGSLAEKAWLGDHWDDWRNLPGPGSELLGPISAVSWITSRYAIYALGTNSLIYEKPWLSKHWDNWVPHHPPEDVTLLDLATTSWVEGRYGLYAVGDNGALYQKWWSLNSWHDWEDLGHPASTTLSGPLTAVSWNRFRFGVYALGADGQVWQKWHAAGWSTWSSVGHAPTPLKTLASTAWASQQYAVAGIASDGHLWAREYRGTWDQYWKDLGHPKATLLAGPLTAVSSGKDSYAYFAQGEDHLSYELRDGKWRVLDGK